MGKQHQNVLELCFGFFLFFAIWLHLTEVAFVVNAARRYHCLLQRRQRYRVQYCCLYNSQKGSALRFIRMAPSLSGCDHTH